MPRSRSCVLCFPWCPLCRAAARARERRAERAAERCRRRNCRRRSPSWAISTTPTRTNASRTVRRTPNAQAVPALLQAASEHADGYVRYRALVLLTGFNDPRTKDAMRESLGEPERSGCAPWPTVSSSTIPIARCVPQFMTALDKEQAEIRPSRAGACACGDRDRHARRRHGSCPSGAAARGVSRRGLLPQRRHRGARRLQGAVCVRRADRGRQARRSPCRTMRRWRSGRLATNARSTRSPACSALRPDRRSPRSRAAICLLGVNCEIAPELSGRHTSRLRTRIRASRNCCVAPPPVSACSALAGRAEAAQALVDLGVPSRGSRPARRFRWRSPPSRCATRRSR